MALAAPSTYDRSVMKQVEELLSSARAHSARGDDHGRAGDVPQALSEWTLALEEARQVLLQDPTSREARHLEVKLRCACGGARLQLGDAARAAQDLRGLPVDSLTGPVLLNRGIAFYFTGDFDGAIADLHSIIQATPEHRTARSLRGRSLVHKQSYEQAIVDLGVALAASPDSEDFAWRGLALQRVGRHREAVADFDEAIRLDSQQAAALGNRARSRLELGETQGAVADLDASLRIQPDAPEVLLERGNARRLLGDVAGARADIERAMGLAPGDWECRPVAQRLLASLA